MDKEIQTYFEQILAKLNDQSQKLDQHTQTLGEHSKLLNEHTEMLEVHSTMLKDQGQTLKDHSAMLKDQGQALKDHSAMLGTQSETLNEHSQLLGALITGQDYLKAELNQLRLQNSKDFREMKEQIKDIEVNLEILKEESWSNRKDIRRVQNTLGLK